MLSDLFVTCMNMLITSCHRLQWPITAPDYCHTEQQMHLVLSISADLYLNGFAGKFMQRRVHGEIRSVLFKQLGECSWHNELSADTHPIYAQKTVWSRGGEILG